MSSIIEPNQPLRLGVVGNPISHSMSPQLHQQFAQQFGIDIQYGKICPTAKGFNRVLNDFFQSGGYGLNVTAPFKQQALDYATIITQRAKDSQSVNTLVKTKEGILGDSTDGIGFVKDLHHKELDFQNKRAVLLGAGGVARCIAQALLLDGFEVYLINRTQSKAQAMAEALNHLGPIQLYTNDIAVDLVVNSVSFNAEQFLPQIKFDNTAVAYDLNYGAKAETFLTAAKDYTALQFDGLGMLIEQGAEAFGLWTGKYPDTSLISL
ncbi:shikimate dehydrogenase [Kangiella koreensis]|uniref:Shikimate dehydrogenase (NADP(+)) n=1 Tax=Kangiella koreensis (strain DSM 16069 / JCM 12317 / KCTC 12182 / SW-125) TaxID=523791 RepID=C7R6R5_KANKD|nr:shikimate dehydrogenase [Kangiella koreensis]ACV25581.1 shikimate 5-dehydrogenase [Kangiella koreensis DSM 16069]